jgi:hypothetical protein
LNFLQAAAISKQQSELHPKQHLFPPNTNPTIFIIVIWNLRIQVIAWKINLAPSSLPSIYTAQACSQSQDGSLGV